MANLIILFHLLTALCIVGLILLQQGKGAEMGASFGSGASQTLFGSGGSGNFFSKMTAVFAVVFFVTSFSLAIIAKQGAGLDSDDIPALIESSAETAEQADAAADDLPKIEVDSSSSDDAPSIEGATVDDLPAAKDTASESAAAAAEDIPEVPTE